MFFKLGIHLFSRKSLSNVMLIMLIAMSFLLTNICVGILNREYSLINSVQNFDKENTYYYVHRSTDDGIHSFLSTNDLNEAIDNDSIDIGYIYYGTGEVVKKYYSSYSTLKYITYIGCDERTSKSLYYNQLMAGEWHTEAKHTDGYVNVVVLEGKYDVGDTFQFTIDTNQLNEDGSIKYITVSCIVTGVLKGGSHMLKPSISYENMDFTQIMPETYTEKDDGENAVVYFSYEDAEIQKNIDKIPLSNCCMLYTDNISKQETEEMVYELNDTGCVVSMQKLCDNTYTVMYDTIMEYVPFVLGVFLLTIVCLICMMTLNSTDHLKIYSIYYLCGMNWNDMKKILFSYSIIVMILAIIVFGLIFAIVIMQGGLLNMVILAYNNLFVTFGIFGVVVFIMVFIPYIILSKSSPKDAIYEN